MLNILVDIESIQRDRHKERISANQQVLNSDKERFHYYAKNPFDYIVHRLGIKPEAFNWVLNPEYENHQWDGTKNPFMEIMNSLVEWNWCGVESAKGVGKTFFAACTIFWFLECFENSLVVTVAPKKEQLTLHVWKELGKLHSKFGRGELTTLKLRMKPGFDDWIAVGFTAGVEAGEVETSAKKAQGFHAEHMLILLEETPGIKQSIITAFQDTCTAPHNLILALGNPDHQFDTLHKFCGLANVKHIRISAKDHPNVVLNNPDFIPGATSRADLERKLNRYGSEDNPLYLSSVRGLSPGQSSDALISMQWCVDSRDGLIRDTEGTKPMDVEAMKKGEPALGVDVANSETGDKAAIAEGLGGVLLFLEDFQCPDSNQLGKRDVAFRMKLKNIKPQYCGVDGVGVGAGTVNALKEMNIQVYNIISSESQVQMRDQTELFDNLRSQMWWQLREDLRKGRVKLLNDEDLFADLVTPKWELKNGKICVESKKDIKKRLGRSPNKGDAVVYWNWARLPRANSFEFL